MRKQMFIQWNELKKIGSSIFNSYNVQVVITMYKGALH